jgi:hypothetical protein
MSEEKFLEKFTVTLENAKNQDFLKREASKLLQKQRNEFIEEKHGKRFFILV